MKGITDPVTPSAPNTKQGCSLGNQQKSPPHPDPTPHPVTHIRQMASQRSRTQFPFIFSASTRLWRRGWGTNIHKLEHQPGWGGHEPRRKWGAWACYWHVSLLLQMEAVLCGSPFPSEVGGVWGSKRVYCSGLGSGFSRLSHSSPFIPWDGRLGGVNLACL